MPARIIFTNGTPSDATAVNANFSECVLNRGAYNAATAYVTNDIVKYSSVRYLAVAPSTGVTPGTDPTKWETF